MEQFGTALVAVISGVIVLSILFNQTLTESLWNMEVGSTHYSLGDNIICEGNDCERTSDGEIVHINYSSPKVEYTDTNCVISSGLVEKGKTFDWKEQIGKCTVIDENNQEIDLKEGGYFSVSIEDPGEYIDEDGNSHVLASQDEEGNFIFNTDYTGSFTLKYTLNYRYQTIETIVTFLIKDASYDENNINLGADALIGVVTGENDVVDNYLLESGGIKYYTKPSDSRVFIFMGIERNKTYKLYSLKGTTKTLIKTFDFTEGKTTFKCNVENGITTCKTEGETTE